MRMMMPPLLICCEGKTEQKYFQILQRIYRLPGARVSIVGEKGQHMALIDRTVEERDEFCGKQGFSPDEVEFCGEHGLSMREREVLYFVLAGRTNAETAHELGVTEGTVKFHMTNILKKTGCATRNEVAKLYNRSLRDW